VLQDKLRGRAGEARNRELVPPGKPASNSVPDVAEKLGECARPDRWPRELGANRADSWPALSRANVPPTGVTSPAAKSASRFAIKGVDAVRKIREVLGPTDPSKAPPGTIRREFGSTIMVNAAHAPTRRKTPSAKWASSKSPKTT
jgi:hypothetical protein